MFKKDSLKNRINKQDQSVGDELKPYAIKNVAIKLSFLTIVLILSFILLNDVNKLAFIPPYLLFIALGISIITLLAFLSYFLFSKDTIKKKLKVYSFYDTVSFICSTISCIMFIILFIFVPTEVNGSSMEKSFYNKDKLLVWHIGYNPKKNDVVIIDINQNYDFSVIDETFFIKRVVATGGDKVEYKDGSLYVNESFVSSSVSYTQFNKMTSFQSKSVLENNIIIEGYSIVMGDNRHNSVDSRYIGAINNDDIEGKVIFRYYSKFGNFGIPKEYINE